MGGEWLSAIGEARMGPAQTLGAMRNMALQDRKTALSERQGALVERLNIAKIKTAENALATQEAENARMDKEVDIEQVKGQFGKVDEVWADAYAQLKSGGHIKSYNGREVTTNRGLAAVITGIEGSKIAMERFANNRISGLKKQKATLQSGDKEAINGLLGRWKMKKPEELSAYLDQAISVATANYAPSLLKAQTKEDFEKLSQGARDKALELAGGDPTKITPAIISEAAKATAKPTLEQEIDKATRIAQATRTPRQVAFESLSDAEKKQSLLKPDFVISLGNKLKQEDAVALQKQNRYLKSPKFRSDVQKDVMALNKDDWRIWDKNQKADALRVETDKRIRQTYPDAQYGKLGSAEGWYTKIENKWVLISPWNE